MTTDPKIKQALERLKLSHEAYGKQYAREKSALAFQVPENQWADDVKTQRKAQTVAGIVMPERPMLSIPTLDQPIQLALNQERQAHLGVQIHPVTEDADEETAEVLQGLYRRIETDSRANLARSWAHERAVKAGRGCYRVNKVMDRDSADPQDQKIVIQRILRQESVYPDPFAEQPDWSDGRFCFITAWMPWSKFKAKYPKAKLSGFDDSELGALAEDAPEWVKGDGEGRAVLIAEYWRLDEDEDSGTRTVFWSTINAIEELEKEQEWDGQYIPIVFTVGRELIPFDHERRWTGIIEPNKDGAKLVNYAASGLVETAALEPKAPFDVDPEEIEGFEDWWKQANLRNFPYLPRHKFKGHKEYGPIQRIQADTGKMQLNAILLEHGREFVRIGTGAFEPTTGEDSNRAKSGRAVLALQQQHDQGNSNWLDNLAEISMPYESLVVLDLIPRLYDRPGRIAMILDKEDNPRQVMLNQPFTMQGKRAVAVPPQMPMGAPTNARPVGMGQSAGAAAQGPMSAMAGQPQAPAPPSVKHYDLTKGRYGFSVSIGKAYKSRVEQGQDQIGQLLQADPQLLSLIGDIYFKFADFPGHTEIAERLKKMLPPQAQPDDAQGDPQQQVQQLQQQLQAVMAQHKALTDELNAKNEMIQTEQVKFASQKDIEQLKGELQIRLKEMDNAKAIRVAEIQAAIKGYQTEAQHAAQHEAQALDIAASSVESDISRESDTAEAETQRQHEAEMAQLGHQQALEQGAQATEGQIAAIKAKPQPTNGGA